MPSYWIEKCLEDSYSQSHAKYPKNSNSNVVNGGHVLQRNLKETIVLNKYDLKWKETSEKCKWEHRTR